MTVIGAYAFSDCSSLSSISLPTGLITIGYNAFSNCVLLESVFIPYGVKNIGSEAFSGCVKLKEINIPENTSNIGLDVFLDCDYSILVITIVIGSYADSWSCDYGDYRINYVYY